MAGKNENREISGVELFGDAGRTEPVEAGLRIPNPHPTQTREVSGESLFGDAGSPEALAMIYGAGAAKEPPKDRFAGLKSLLGKLKKAFTIEAPKDGATCDSPQGACPFKPHSNFRNWPY